MNLKPEYIELGGRKLRVEVNWNAICEFTEITGIEFNDFCQQAIDKKASPTSIRSLIYVSIKEGERMDGHEFTISELDLGADIRPGAVFKFIEIFTRQWNDAKKKTD